MRRGLRIIFVLTLVFGNAYAWPASAADPIKLAVIKTSPFGPFFIAQEKGYFAREGLAAQFVFFEAPTTMAPAVVAGDADIATVNANGGFLGLAAQGAVRIIAGALEEAPGFHDFVVVASNGAYAGGVKSFADLTGHTAAVGTLASPQAYSLELIEQKYRIDQASVRLVQMNSLPNVVSAVIGGQTDIAVNPTTTLAAALAQDKVKLLGYVGDEVQWQTGVVFTRAKLADGETDFINRFLRAYRSGTRDYHDAFTGPGGQRRDGPEAANDLAIMSKYLGQPPEQIAATIGYFDADARLDEKDILKQVNWYKSQGLVKADVDGEKMIDKRYVVSLPEK